MSRPSLYAVLTGGNTVYLARTRQRLVVIFAAIAVPMMKNINVDQNDAYVRHSSPES